MSSFSVTESMHNNTDKFHSSLFLSRCRYYLIDSVRQMCGVCRRLLRSHYVGSFFLSRFCIDGANGPYMNRPGEEQTNKKCSVDAKFANTDFLPRYLHLLIYSKHVIIE